MPFTFADPRTEELIRVLHEHPDGATLAQIAARLQPIPEERTLQRWLAKLIVVRLVKRRGGSKNTRYFSGTGRVALLVKKRAPKPTKPAVSPPIVAPKPEAKLPEKPSHLPPQYRPLFDRLAPKIIRMGYADDVAVDELMQGFTKEFRGADVEIANGFVEAGMLEFDDLDYATAQKKYGTSKPDWDNWRTEWCTLRGLSREKT